MLGEYRFGGGDTNRPSGLEKSGGAWPIGGGMKCGGGTPGNPAGIDPGGPIRCGMNGGGGMGGNIIGE